MQNAFQSLIGEVYDSFSEDRKIEDFLENLKVGAHVSAYDLIPYIPKKMWSVERADNYLAGDIRFKRLSKGHYLKIGRY